MADDGGGGGGGGGTSDDGVTGADALCVCVYVFSSE